MASNAAPVSLDAHRSRKADVRTEAVDLRMELDARKTEALRLVVSAQPYIHRLEMVAREIGPEAMQTVYGLGYLIARYGRQWDDPEPAA